MAKKRIEHEKYSDEVEAHLARYLERWAKRTGIERVVILRYTVQPPYPDGHTWLRAIVEDSEGTQVRIYYYNYWRVA